MYLRISFNPANFKIKISLKLSFHLFCQKNILHKKYNFLDIIRRFLCNLYKKIYNTIIIEENNSL